ncbi:hypothetical protein INS49_009164 [Diaporthe citri]|uniref:uncharacterized protein n=1 Tax=Diaporthe citri TaxID=83186 RepID=UPI001C7EA5A9|nr:uncharacterized protein INS49_009164 [Diaporthe citri]KAG6364061.1 hypothetical protein INS49_009164 [Diaporthe citri]
MGKRILKNSIDNSSRQSGQIRGNMFVSSGGSGHGFRFLLILGHKVVETLEGKTDGNVYADMWARREPQGRSKRNDLEEGEGGPHVLAKQTMASDKDCVQ